MTPPLSNISHRSSHRHESRIARAVRLRRNALIANVFGVFGILQGTVMVLFPFGITEDPDTEFIIDILIFLCGYASVILGCSWWVKAKAWESAVILIGLAPLAILAVPFVRLIYLANPLLLPLGMIMMPLILIVVVFVLPDKSGIMKPKRGRWGRG